MTIAKQTAKHLLEIEAVFLKPEEPFTWASGIKSPIYCDNRMTLGFPNVRRAIAKGLAAEIKANYPDVDVIAGTATAGIPHAAFIAEELDLPMIYVRSEPKKHGKGKQIEGPLAPGKKVVMIEDLISTAGSCLKAAKAVEEAGSEVIAIAAIFTYELAAAQRNLEAANIPLLTLTNYSTLLEVAAEDGYVKEAELETLREWNKDPENWNK
ncbi:MULTISPECIES: orotate phosphoribosyltransferase [Brochothrix]|uniref:Orotate phosphoribosyltransferase n=1 Tax=Brochothrix thermosphacta TaxID=2756 RepID=A0A1D2LXV8_BROTH|nr:MULTISPECIES: orotate phosphoribosyltransferase [Brochothrix]SLM94139.1 Orotate phosphoribosyltransferase [Brachybacterium faecium]ANZ94186.1 orotate phosphoribosyltransferase [Brochothrix thermosphacta]ANZ97520.1 orotate phosphoribosyltransferase [Brochothrix thermosphacta]ATF26964.1 orotate phosphoribosyltransferase [Brochothrix thermosphacta]ATH86321.1 orotate phosphoribosyltransferase [Brochothrix thermosphacta]